MGSLYLGSNRQDYLVQLIELLGTNINTNLSSDNCFDPS